MGNAVHSYPKIWSVGHAAITELLLDDVIVEEKVDGSQFSFGIYSGELRCRSKNKDIILDNPEKMFAEGVNTVRELASNLHDGWTYRGEYLQGRGHNHLTYDRIPDKHISLFDINPVHGQWMSRAEREAEAARIGLECVPLLFEGRLEHIGQFDELVKRSSYLGGPQIEGVVIKNYHRFGRDSHPLFGKFVREDFKEAQNADWKTKHQSMSDIRDELGRKFQMTARWQKAVQRMREDGTYTGTPQDIGSLIKIVQQDLHDEARDQVSKALMDWAWPHISRVSIRGLPEWFKGRLVEQQFAQLPGEEA